MPVGKGGWLFLVELQAYSLLLASEISPLGGTFKDFNWILRAFFFFLEKLLSSCYHYFIVVVVVVVVIVVPFGLILLSFFYSIVVVNIAL